MGINMCKASFWESQKIVFLCFPSFYTYPDVKLLLGRCVIENWINYEPINCVVKVRAQLFN